MIAVLFLNAALSTLVFIAILGVLAKSIGTGDPLQTRRSRRIALRTPAPGVVAVSEA